MQPLSRTDIVGKAEYERERPDFRRRVIVQKEKRRVLVGGHCSLHFENRDTMRYQVQEMLRAEDSWTRDGAVDDELEAYNALIPRRGTLSATLMLEYETPEERAVVLPKLVGIDRHVWLHIGDTPPVAAVFDRAQMNEARVSAVQYVKFELSPEQLRLLGSDGTVVRIAIDHPAYAAQAVVSEETRKALASDAG